jgi:hypothetical protein
MKLNILLLCNKPNVGYDANTIVDHIEAIEGYSTHNIWLYSNMGSFSPKLDLNKFDVIIIHYSLCLLNNYYIAKESKRRLRAYKGLKIAFIQDEYRQINKMIRELAFLDIDVLFTCFPESEIEKIYPNTQLPKVSKYNNLTGYVPQRLMDIQHQPPIHKRPIHVGYRGRKIPYWLGELAYEKWTIAETWKKLAMREDIKTDISYNEKDRIYGHKWNEFLSSCKTTLGVESGASVMDFTGELEKVVDAYQLLHPNDSFHTVQKKFLSEYEGKYKLNQISPRCFEAIALKTVLVLYEGEYSGILIPDRHYIKLKKDFSNVEEVLERIRDNDFLQKMADTAYEEIAQSGKYSYQTFIKHVDEVIASEFMARGKAKAHPYIMDDFKEDIKHITLKAKLYKKGLIKYQRLPLTVRLMIKGVLRPQLAYKEIKRLFFSAVRPASKE